MPSPSVTYSFSNATVADAAQVNQNFTDVINGITDGTKDISVSALTAAGNVSFTGSSITLGNASSDDLTITASLASTINIKTTASYDIGSSSLGLAGIYFGANSQTVRIAPSGSMSATWTLTLPTTAGTANYALTTNGSGVTSWTAWSTSAWAATTSALGTVYLPNAQVVCNTGVSGGATAGRGGSSSGQTNIRNFATVTTTGTGITRTAQTTTTADFFTINEAGVYAIGYTDRNTAGTDWAIGITLNADSTDVNNSINGIATTTCIVGFVLQPSATYTTTVCGIRRLAANDIIRGHVSTHSFAGDGNVKFCVTQLFRTA